MIPLYILGLLLRFGPQHGYQIKKMLEEQLEDFTQIKLPTVYYHLEKMQAKGLITAHSDKQGARPEKTVYEVGEAGAAHFQELLLQSLKIEYRPTFDIDGTIYFSDSLKEGALAESLSAHIDNLQAIIAGLETHCNETLGYIPAQYRTSAKIIFDHHLLHYKAELEWALQSRNSLIEEAKK
ncbi:PadR family transcriptional regulator [Clostridium merdae]|uniref:PadR family transcriptional regulator n=1 Tax=Clostridium merdae TaxID=1958780 RepID=UPI000A270D08|nr:PadR family transcriptional regulator [Clostridium merdae]